MWIQVPALPLVNIINFNKLGDLSAPWTPQLSNGDSNKYLAGLF